MSFTIIKMKATIPYIEQKFEEFNRQMFGGKLPKIPVELSDGKTIKRNQ